MVSDRISDRVSGMGQNVAQAGSQMKEAVRDQWENIRDTTSDYIGQGREVARQFGRSLEGDIRNHPMRWITISAAIGIGVGLVAYFLFSEDTH